MIREVEAIYENGVLRPVHPLNVEEKQRVRLMLNDAANGPDIEAAASDRAAEMQWIARERRNFAGQWVALSGNRLVAHGSDGYEVWRSARAAGVDRPFLSHLPDLDELPFGGW